MKVIKNKAFRLLFFIIGFAGIIAALFFLFDAVTAYEYFDDGTDSNTPFAESEYIKSVISSTVFEINNKTSIDKELNEIDFDSMDLTFYDFNTPDKKESVDVKTILGTDEYYNAIYTAVIGSDNNSFYSYFDKSYVDSIPDNVSGTFYRMSLKDYLRYIKENGERYDVSLMNQYQEKWNDKGDFSPKDDTEKAYQIINGLFAEGKIYTDSESGIIYYLYDSKNSNLLMYFVSENYIYREGDFAQTGHQDLEKVTSDYIYLDYKEKMTKEDFMDSFMYCSAAEAVFGTLPVDSKQIIKNNNLNTYLYSEGANSAYSFDDKNIQNLYLSDMYEIDEIYKLDNDKYNISYKDFSDKLENVSDVYVKYDKYTGNLIQRYKTPNGEIKDFNYLSVQQINTIKNNNVSFVIGTRLYGASSSYGSMYAAYEISRQIPSPITLAIIGFIAFLLAVVILTIGEPKKLIWFDKIPYLFLVGAFVLMFIGVLCLLEEVFRNSISIFSVIMTEPAGVLIGIITVALIIYLICAVIYLSFIRRIKCGKFLDGFITVKIIRYFRKYLKGDKRLIIFVGSFCLASLLIALLIGTVCEFNEIMLIVALMLLLDLAFVMIVIKYMSDTQKLIEVSERIQSGELDAKIDTQKLSFNNKELGANLNNLGEGLSKAVEASVRDERTKAELITNVSHDIKTPLTSIINYVDLLKRENIESPKAKEYIDVLDKKSERLKQLILDLIEASKTSTGNIELEKMNLNIVELTGQIIGEYEDKFAEKNLELVKNISTDNAYVYADGRRVFRIIDNVFGNVYKYAQDGTRVYLNLGFDADKKNVILSLKNVSKEMLNISADELTERFVRGDKARHTEGSGLGLSIAKNLTELHDGTFKINIDGDLFTVIISLPLAENNNTVQND